MTDRERILATIRGQAPDRVPFVPRLDFWHRAHRRKGTLPAEFSGMSVGQIADRLGASRYSIIPDFTRQEHELDMIDYGLGVFRLPTLLYEPQLDGSVDRRVTRHGSEIAVEYHTPAGSIRTAFLFTPEMLDAGASVPWITGHAIEKPADFEVVAYIFAHLKVVPRLERYRAQREDMGERGIVVAWLGGSACPIHHILRELMPVEQFFYALHDEPARVHSLAAAMAPYYEGIRAAGLDSEAEVVFLGGNYDDAITHPAFFREYILPALSGYAEALHARGKFLMTHTDGENRRLMPLYREAAFDVADSVCPHPMTRLTLDELLEGFGGRITLCGGIPSVLLCRESASESTFREFIRDVVQRHGRRPRFILGVSDMVTADADFDRLRYLADTVRSF